MAFVPVPPPAASELGGGETAPSLEQKLPAVGSRWVAFVVVTEWSVPVDEGSPWVFVARIELDTPLPVPPVGVLDLKRIVGGEEVEV